MKKTILLSALSLAIALPAQAHEEKAPTSVKTEGFYAGLDLGISNQVNDIALTTGYGLFAGYEFKLADKITTAIEVDYYNWGEFDSVEAAILSIRNYTDVDTSLSSYAISAKPRYYVTDSFFVGGVVGFGSYSFDATATGYESLELDNGSGMVFGVETGYQHSNGFNLRAGYKTSSVDFDKKDTADLNSFYAGIGYKF
ncbi:outer membrane beta-barrel protein [Vibrio sp. SCSIO 43132]|uniref:outer membrane beta-barrel protein n=1 Tax=Vibrio sp. SCSIO 43132 TaxID=2779363 RepID=UPI001CA8BFD4|nr:outer membrane beta-barrel protein [Vibrio sp. SCSIO 43132]UAB70141.1 outer membrane beta-barrel protein [Vibrio sp. SCSIO 43132]